MLELDPFSVPAGLHTPFTMTSKGQRQGVGV